MEKNFKNLKRNLIALVMSGIMLAGCGDKVPGFDYTTGKGGIIEVFGSTDYSIVSKLRFIRLVNEKSGYEEYFLAYKYNTIGVRGYPSELQYINVENGKVIYCDSDEIFNDFKMEVLAEQLIDYLYKYDIVKNDYAIEDILYIKECLLSDEVLFPNVTANKPIARKRMLIKDGQFIV